MTRPETRLLASAATALGLAAGGFEAHLAPQGEAIWHGLTGVPSPLHILAALFAALAVWLLGRLVPVTAFLWMSAGLLPLIPAVTGIGGGFLIFSNQTMMLAFAILLGWAARNLVADLPRLEPLHVLLISFAFFLAVGRFIPGPAGPQGDEPHYLLIAESLIRDGDIDLRNQFDERAFSKFTSADLDPHTAPRSPKGRLYAIHTPGLSALIAPGYAAAGYAGARAVVSFWMAATVSLIFLVSRSLFGGRAGHFVFFLATFASPLPIYANSVFPDSVAPFALAVTLACLVTPRPAFAALASASIAVLPWLHPRFLPFAAVLALAISMRGGFSPGRAGLAFGPLAVSVGLLLAHFQSLFGTASLSAAYGPGFASDVSLARVPWGALALLLDRQFGLLLFAPVLLLGLAGARALWKRDGMVALVVLAVFGAQLGTGGAFSMWWGGASAPARFLIGALPALLILCAACFEESKERRPVLGAAGGFSLGLLWLACLAPRALHNRADGESGLLRLLTPVLDLDRLFPGFVVPDGGLFLSALWVVALTAAIARPRLGVWVAGIPIAFGVLTSAKPLLDPFPAALRVLEAWEDHRRTFGGVDAKGAFILDVPLGGSPWEVVPGASLYSRRFSLPEGAWILRVESRSEPTPDALNVARVSLVRDDEKDAPSVAVLVRVGETRAEAAFDLPRAERRLRVKGEGLQSRSTILRIRLTPRPDARFVRPATKTQ
ncbi:MAG: hypothetical protein K1Y01_13620 [Vicinamibacteria bacterium]|nr:hypothetical protein [Vicinamibacteria bacterium]